MSEWTEYQDAWEGGGYAACPSCDKNHHPDSPEAADCKAEWDDDNTEDDGEE